MRLMRSQHTLEVRTNIAPLIDIVLLLIVFCMTVTQMTKAHSEELDLPEAEQGIGLEELKPQRLVINILKDGQIMLRETPHTLDMVASVLDESIDSIKARETTVVFRCDRAVPWATVARLSRMCTNKGIHRVRVAVIEPEGISRQ